MSNFWKLIIAEAVIILILVGIFFYIKRPELASIPFLSWLIGKTSRSGLSPKKKEIEQAETNIKEAEASIKKYEEEIQEIKDKQIILTNDLDELKDLGKIVLGKQNNYDILFRS